jgi:hypothetical protein
MEKSRYLGKSEEHQDGSPADFDVRSPPIPFVDPRPKGADAQDRRPDASVNGSGRLGRDSHRVGPVSCGAGVTPWAPFSFFVAAE